MTTAAITTQTVTLTWQAYDGSESRVGEPASSLPNGTVVYADGQLWTACAGYEKNGLRWQQANGWGSGNDRYMAHLLSGRWADAGPSRIVQLPGEAEAGR